MKSSYFVIELSSRWLTVLLAALAVSLIMAFAFGYGAAWSVLAARPPQAPPVLPTPAPTATSPPAPTAAAEMVAAATVVVEPTPTLAPTPLPTEVATVVPTRPPATVTPVPPKPTTTAVANGLYWVQILASSQRETLHQAGPKLVELGFGPKNQRVEVSQSAGGELYKLRIGPFPDRASAERVSKRMRAAGFGDAWVVAP